MPKNKFQDVVFTAIMATIMVYGMVVYNVALNTGGVTGQTFLMAVHELPIMVPIAFVLEFFVVGKSVFLLQFFFYDAENIENVPVFTAQIDEDKRLFADSFFFLLFA